MGSISRGKYKFGSKSFAQINLLISSPQLFVGDSVYDTTHLASQQYRVSTVAGARFPPMPYKAVHIVQFGIAVTEGT